MRIQCVSNLIADPAVIPIPGQSTLTFDVQIIGGPGRFDVHYVIVSNAELVRFATGRPEEIISVDGAGAQMRITHDAHFVCMRPGQVVPGFVSFTVEARVVVNNTLMCMPPNHPAIRVNAWNCGAPGAAGPMMVKAPAVASLVAGKKQKKKVRR